VLSTDVTQMRRFATGLDTPNPSFNEQQRADCSPRSTLGDGAINSGDVVQTRRYAAGLDPPTDGGGPTAPPSGGDLDGTIGGDLLGQGADSNSILLLMKPEKTEDGRFNFPVVLDANVEAAAVSFTVAFDAVRFGRPSVSLGDRVFEGTVLTVNDAVEGELTILVDSSTALGDAGKPIRIVDIAFEIVDEASLKSHPFAFRGVPSLSDAFGNDLTVTFFDPVGHPRVSSNRLSTKRYRRLARSFVLAFLPGVPASVPRIWR